MADNSTTAKVHPWPTNDDVYISPAGDIFRLIERKNNAMIVEHVDGWSWEVDSQEFASSWKNA